MQHERTGKIKDILCENTLLLKKFFLPKVLQITDYQIHSHIFDM